MKPLYTLIILLFFSCVFTQGSDTQSESRNQNIDISDKTWSIAGGLGTNRGFTLLGLSKDFRINDNFSCFITTGIGYSIIGAGFSFQNNYNNKGFNIAINYGLQLIDELEDSKYYIWHVVANYQWKIGKTLFLSSGLMAGIHYNYGGEECHLIDDSAHCFKTCEKSGYALPTISLDYRF